MSMHSCRRARPVMALILASGLALGPGLARPAAAQEQGRGAIRGVLYETAAMLKKGFWTSPGGIALLSVLGVGAGVAVAGNNNNNNNASPSSP